MRHRELDANRYLAEGAQFRYVPHYHIGSTFLDPAPMRERKRVGFLQRLLRLIWR